jgi:hypothetical protein
MGWFSSKTNKVLLCFVKIKPSDIMILAKGTKVSPKDQIYTQLSHLRMTDA